MIKRILVSIILTILAVPAFAVTEKEMEEARAITAQAYLRYANDGSGYLDEFRATSMSQLESKLKAKEKENLKAFKTVKVPGDYASWDKAKLVEFWGVTFFTSPNLAEKGKAARTRVKQRINAMTVAAPSAKKEEKPAETTPVEEPKEVKPADVAAADAQAENASTSASEAEKLLEKQEEILADQNAIAQDTEDRQYKKEDNSTWIYVVVLIVLIGVVIWLVVFAANMMKKQSEPLEQNARNSTDGADSRENAELRKQYASQKKALDEYKAAFEEAQAENKRLRIEIKTIKAELSEALAARDAAVRAQKSSAVEAPRPAAAPAQPSVLYLGRVNGRGLFVRADRRLNPGHTIYRLETRDGLVGTFHVVDTPEVTDIALNNPVEYLSGGCNAIDIEDTAGASNIVTENAGTAMFENGAWKVLRKSRIRFE